MLQRADTMAIANNQISYSNNVELKLKDPMEKAAMFSLGQMGFIDYEKNLKLCKKHKNELNAIVVELSM